MCPFTANGKCCCLCSSELPKYRLWETVSFSTLSSQKAATLKNTVMAVMDVLEGLRGEPGLPGLLSHNGKLGLCVCERLQLKALTAVMAHKYVFVYRGAAMCLNCPTKWCESQLGSIYLLLLAFASRPRLRNFLNLPLKCRYDAKDYLMYLSVLNRMYSWTGIELQTWFFLQIWFSVFMLDSEPGKF